MSNLCPSCENAIDSIEHHFFYCQQSQKLWKEVKNWIHTHLDISFDFTVCEVIFGIPSYMKT